MATRGPKYNKEKCIEFVSYYTDPTSPAFGNAAKSAELAGYSSDYGKNLVKKPYVQEMIAELTQARAETGVEVEKYLRTFDAQAAKELIDQLEFGQELKFIDIEKEMGKGLKKAGESKEQADRAREINKHNSNVCQAARVRKEALTLMLAYRLGTPQQKHLHKHKHEVQDPLQLRDLGDEQLQELRQALNNMIPEAKYQVLPAEVEE